MNVPLFVPYPTLTFAPIFVAEDTGILKRHAPEIHVQLGGHDQYLEVLSGRGEGIVPILHMGLRAFDRGHPFRIITTIFHEVVHRLVAQRDVRSIPGLKGKTVMVNAFRGASDLEIRYVMRKAGLSPDEVHFVEAGPDLEMAQLVALRRGEVAAIASSAPYWYTAEREGFVVLGDASRYYAEWVPAALVTHADWVGANRDLALRVRRAFDEVVVYIRSRPEAIVPILHARIPEFRVDGSGTVIDHIRGGWDPSHREAGLRNYIQAYCTEFNSKMPRFEDLMLAG